MNNQIYLEAEEGYLIEQPQIVNCCKNPPVESEDDDGWLEEWEEHVRQLEESEDSDGI